jgi:hypothetical protein
VGDSSPRNEKRESEIRPIRNIMISSKSVVPEASESLEVAVVDLAIAGGARDRGSWQ